MQIGLQTTAFFFNKSASDKVWGLIDDSQIPRQYSFVSNEKLFICSGLPPSGDPFETVCWPIAGPGVAVGNTTQMSPVETERQNRIAEGERKKREDREVRAISMLGAPRIVSRDLTVVPTFDDGAVVGVNVTGLNDDDPQQVTQLSARCIKALNWPSIVYVRIFSLASHPRY